MITTWEGAVVVVVEDPREECVSAEVRCGIFVGYSVDPAKGGAADRTLDAFAGSDRRESDIASRLCARHQARYDRKLQGFLVGMTRAGHDEMGGVLANDARFQSAGWTDELTIIARNFSFVLACRADHGDAFLR